MRRMTFLLLLLLAPAASAAPMHFEITVAAGKHDRKNEPVCVPLTLPEPTDKDRPIFQVRLLEGKEDYGIGQLTKPGLAATGAKEPAPNAELHFILRELKAGSEIVLHFDYGPPIAQSLEFRWTDVPDQYSALSVHDSFSNKDRPVLRYVDIPLDESTKEKREDTFKVYHHLYTPDGSRLATKGVGGLYTHHRGLFFGFMKVTYDGNKTVDIWHCKDQTYQGHEKTLVQEAGSVLGRHRVQIGWHGQNKEKFATEERELTAYALPGGTLVDFVSRVTPVKGTVKFDGDPQHAGFHFRADNEVDKNKTQTIFIRPDGVGEPGKERNYPGDKQMVNLPWDAMSFVLGDKRYTLAYLDHPANPKEARDSERTYGRIGSYFVTEATPDKPLLVRYRVWLQEGQMKPEEVAALSSAFVEPVTVKTK